jgi:hypothetical protein
LLGTFGDAGVGLVAVDGARQLVVGAALATRLCRRTPFVGPGIALHVIEPCRRQGIAASLLASLARVVQTAGATALYAAKRVDEGSDEERGWQWLGFSPCETVQQHLLPLNQFEPQLAPLVDRMRERGRIPAAARIIPLYQSDLPAVLQLHLDNLGGDRGDLYRRLRGQGTDAFLPRDSRVLLVDGKVRGCILGHRLDADTIAVDADIVDSGIRGGWANVWLKLESTRVALRMGVKNFQYTTFDHYADTRSFTHKLGGMTTRTTLLMHRPLQRKASS